MMEAAAFGPFVLDLGRGVLLQDGRPVPLGQRAFSVLAVLAGSSGRDVPKSELMSRVWPEAFVEEGNLTVQIAALRKALGETADGQSWILTVPRVGYRLLSAPRSLPTASDLPSQPKLAVLPFLVLGDDTGEGYFAEGVVEDIIIALSRFRSFAVVARNVSFAYRGRADARQVAADLGVRYVLEGSVRRAGDRLRLSAQLIDGDSSAPLWAERFDGALEEIFDFQDRITDTVAQLVEPHIQVAEIEHSRRERPGSFALYDIYLRTLAKISTETEPDNAEALALLTGGLALEPDNAMLLGHAAWALEHRLAMGWPPLGPDDRQLCGELARRGLEHAAGDALVMAHCGISLLQGAKEYDLGMAAIEEAVAANPNNLKIVGCAGVAHLHCGRLDEALHLFHRATRLSPGDPGSHSSLCGLAHVHLIRGEHQEALEWARRAFTASPNFDATLWMLIAANAHLGRMEEAGRFLDKLRQRTPSVTVAKIRAGQPDRDPSRIAAVLEGLRLAGLPEE